MDTLKFKWTIVRANFNNCIVYAKQSKVTHTKLSFKNKSYVSGV